MLPEFRELYERNPDIVGWLQIDGTRIEYPVMQNTQDSQYYLNHDFDRKDSKGGLPFLDEHSRINGSDILLIHGHHMKSGWMFKDLMKYKKESFYKEHATFNSTRFTKRMSMRLLPLFCQRCIENRTTCLNTTRLRMSIRQPSSIRMFRALRSLLFMTRA